VTLPSCCAGENPPVELLSDTRTGPDHVGVRFRDYGTGWQVLLDGVDVTRHTREALAGPDGWVLVDVLDADGKLTTHAGDHFACEVRRGHVQITRPDR